MDKIIPIVPLLADRAFDDGMNLRNSPNELLQYFQSGFKDLNTPASAEVYQTSDNKATACQGLHSKYVEPSINNKWSAKSIRNSQTDQLVMAPIQYDFAQQMKPTQGVYGGYGTLL